MNIQVQKIIDGITKDATINIYTLRRGLSKDIEKKYELHFATVKGKPKEYISELLLNFLKNKLEDIKNVKPFFDYHSESSFCYHLEAVNIEGFEFVLNKMNQHHLLETIKELDLKTDSIIIELKLGNNQRCLFFQKLDTKKVMKKKFLNMIISDGIFDRIVNSDKQLELKPYFDFIYLQSSNNFLIFEKLGFEQVFNFREFYRETAINALNQFKSKGIVVFSKEVENIIGTKNSIMNKMTKLFLCNRFDTIDTNPQNIKKYNDDWKLTINLKDGKIAINDMKELQDFFNVVSKNCVEEGITKEKFIARSKDEVK